MFKEALCYFVTTAELKVIPLKLFYYQTIFETWHNQHSLYEHYITNIICGHRACLPVSRLLNWGVKNSNHFHRRIEGTQSAMGPRWPAHYFCQFETRLPKPENQIYVLSYLVKNSIQRNINRRGEKRIGAWRE